MYSTRLLSYQVPVPDTIVPAGSCCTYCCGLWVEYTTRMYDSSTYSCRPFHKKEPPQETHPEISSETRNPAWSTSSWLCVETENKKSSLGLYCCVIRNAYFGPSLNTSIPYYSMRAQTSSVSYMLFLTCFKFLRYFWGIFTSMRNHRCLPQGFSG